VAGAVVAGGVVAGGSHTIGIPVVAAGVVEGIAEGVADGIAVVGGAVVGAIVVVFEVRVSPAMQVCAIPNATVVGHNVEGSAHIAVQKLIAPFALLSL
jgi:hypothetical protein